MDGAMPPEARLTREMYEVAFALRNQLDMLLDLWEPTSPGLRTVLEFASHHIVVVPGDFDRTHDVGDGTGARQMMRRGNMELPERMDEGGRGQADREEVDQGGEEEDDEDNEDDEGGEEEDDEDNEDDERGDEEEEEEEEDGSESGQEVPMQVQGQQKRQALQPDIFGRMPSSLLPSIFARLRLPDIKKVRLLSKEWNRKVITPGSDFQQVWEKLRSSRIAIIFPLVTRDKEYRFCVSAYDERTREWYQAIYNSERHYLSICACEGGLVCFMYYIVNNRMAMARKLKMEDQMRLVVWNPLTGDEEQLPSLPRYLNQRAFHRVVQLSVNRQTKGYTVRLISKASGTNTIPGGYATIVYNSETRLWFCDQCKYGGQALDRFVYGRSYRCAYDDFTGDGLKGIWSYDIVNRVLIEAHMDLDLMSENPVPLPLSKFAFSEGRVFRLYKGSVSQPFWIEELQYPQGEVPPHGTCTIIKQHRCPPLDNLLEAEYYAMWLFACKGYLMVASMRKPNKTRPQQNPNTAYQHEQHLWLYNLSTNAWRVLLTLANPVDFGNDEFFVPYRDFMCELQADIRPRTQRY